MSDVSDVSDFKSMPRCSYMKRSGAAVSGRLGTEGWSISILFLHPDTMKRGSSEVPRKSGYREDRAAGADGVCNMPCEL